MSLIDFFESLRELNIDDLPSVYNSVYLRLDLFIDPNFSDLINCI